MNKNSGDKLSSEILRQKAEELLNEKSEAKILELIEELAFQNEEKAKRAEELLIANKELAFQNEEKAKRANELIIANKELAFQAEISFANSKVIKLNNELEVHQIELEMNNKELSCLKEKAEADARKYAELYDYAPSGYYTLSNDGTIIEVNICGATMLGKDRPQLKSNRFGLFVSNDTRTIFNLFLNKVFSSTANESCDVTLSARRKKPMYVHLTGIVAENGNECLVTMVDMTESMIMAELHQSEQRYHALVDWSPYAVIVHRNLIIVYANPAAIIMFGATCAQDLVGTKILDRIHPDCHQIVMERIRRGIDDGIDAVLSEFKYFKLDGTIIYAEAQGTTITYDGVPCILASMRDITERKRVENLLIDTNLKLDLAMDIAGTGWWEMDIPTGSVIFSKHHFEMLGYAPESFKHSRDLTNLIHPEDYDRTMNAMQGHLNGLFERYEVEYRIKTKSGEYIWFYDNGSVVKKDANGNPLIVSGIVVNTTARKHAEHEIEQSHARFSAMISNITDVIAIMDIDGFKKYESPNMKKIFGWLPEDNAGRSAFSFVHPDDLPNAQKFFHSLLGEDNSTKTLEFRYECKDGS
ncbi:MAG: PAS domain S-box protein, partial [bacterium]